MARPKLKPGEKGRYHVSRKEQAKRTLKKKISAKTKERERLKYKTSAKTEQKKKAEKALKILEQGGLVKEEFLKELPPSVQEAMKEGTELTFKPNEGPQTEFLAAPEKEVLYGGAAGGGKSYAMLMDLLRYADNQNHRALLLRRTLPELTELIDKSKQIYPKAFPRARFKESTKTWEFPSGATALFSYVDKDDDVYRYQGQSFTWIGIDELGHYPTPYVWNYLRSRLRTTDPKIVTYMRASSNPGGAGGWWVKKMFVDPAPPDQPFWATDIETGRTLSYGPGHTNSGQPLFQRKFLPARLTDNPYLANDGEYEAMLLSLPEVERKRLLSGDWDVAEGAAFKEFNREVHVIDPIELPYNWVRVRACDYGYSAPSCVLWGAIDWDNNIWIYRELYIKRHTGEQLADLVLQMESDDPKMYIGVLDRSCWNKTGHGLSVAESMIRKGVRWVPSNSDRVNGKIEVHRRLQVDDYGNPRIRIFNTCTNLVRTLPTLPISKTNSEDIDTRTEDHAYDALRYMIMNRQTTSSLYNFKSNITDSAPVMEDAVFGY